VTELAVREAERYIEQVLKSQQKLGYTTPGTPVVKAAVDNAAEAMNALFALRASRNGH
jgi:hypothetical protein